MSMSSPASVVTPAAPCRRSSSRWGWRWAVRRAEAWYSFRVMDMGRSLGRWSHDTNFRPADGKASGQVHPSPHGGRRDAEALERPGGRGTTGDPLHFQAGQGLFIGMLLFAGEAGGPVQPDLRLL